MPPKTIAPRRPLPTGSARTHSAVAAWRVSRGASAGSSGWSEAGPRYHRLSSDAGGGASPVRCGGAGDCIAATATPATNAPASAVSALYRVIDYTLLTVSSPREYLSVEPNHGSPGRTHAGPPYQ